MRINYIKNASLDHLFREELLFANPRSVELFEPDGRWTKHGFGLEQPDP